MTRAWRPEDIANALPEALRSRLRCNVALATYTSLLVGGPADVLLTVRSAEELAEAVCAAQRTGMPWFLLGGGSNLCIADAGIRGLVIHNRAAELTKDGVWRVATGHDLRALFLRAAADGFGGLEFAVGIPGTVGGALVSNAGAYRRSIEPLVRRLCVASEGETRVVDASWMEFSYRDSRLRRRGLPRECVVWVELALEPRPRHEILEEAREYQRNRIHRQPWHPSAGSFFKNVYDAGLAAEVPGLPEPLREAGIVPAGYLSSAAGCCGLRVGGAEVSPRHGNFITNRYGATAEEIRELAETVKRRVYERFGVRLEEEVLYAGQWDTAQGRQ